MLRKLKNRINNSDFVFWLRYKVLSRSKYENASRHLNVAMRHQDGIMQMDIMSLAVARRVARFIMRYPTTPLHERQLHITVLGVPFVLHIYEKTEMAGQGDYVFNLYEDKDNGSIDCLDIKGHAEVDRLHIYFVRNVVR